MTDIRVSHLVKQYEEKTAVNDINFTVGEHEFLVLVGPSGWQDDHLTHAGGP